MKRITCNVTVCICITAVVSQGRIVPIILYCIIDVSKIVSHNLNMYFTYIFL